MGALPGRWLRGDPNGDGLLTWQAWSNGQGSGKYLVLDADFSQLQIALRNQGVSRDTAPAMIEAIADPLPRERVRDFLLDFPVSCALPAEVPAGCG